MADNELDLKCRICGETFYLGKRFQKGYYRNSNLDTGELLAFFDKHYNKCSRENLTWGADIFDVECEINPTWKKGSTEREELLEGVIKLAKERIEQLEMNISLYEKVQQEFFVEKSKAKCKYCAHYATTLSKEDFTEAIKNDCTDAVCDLYMCDGFSPNDYCSKYMRREDSCD